MTFRKPILFLLFVAVSCTVGAQLTSNYRFANFGVKDGLTDKYVYSCVQDKAGYMWFATSTGLFRYDGHLFTYVRSPIDREGRTIANILQTIHYDRKGNLWLGAFTDLQWYNPEKNIFWRPRESDSVAQLLSKAYITNFIEDKAGNIWITTVREGLFRFRVSDSTFTHYRGILPAGLNSTILKVVPGNSEEQFAILEAGILAFSEPGKPGIYYPMPAPGINCAIAEDGDIYIGFMQPNLGILRFNLETRKIVNDFPANEQVFKKNLIHNLVKRKNTWWVAGYDLIKVSSGINVERIEGKQSGEFSLQAWKLAYLYFDRQENLWICSYNGVSMMSPQNQQVKQALAVDPGNKNSLEPLRMEVVNRNGDWLMGTSNSSGLLYYSTTTNSLSVIPHPYSKNKAINGLVKLPDGSVLVSDMENLFLYRYPEPRLTPVSLTDEAGNRVKGIFRGCYNRQGNVFMASYNNGFYIWRPGSNTAKHIRLSDINSNTTTITSEALYPCFTDSKGNTWFTSSFGVFEYRVKENRYHHYLTQRQPGAPLAGETQYITEDKYGHFWVCTLNNGLYELYVENGKEVIRNYSKNSNIGLPSDYLIKILPNPGDSTLWLQTGSGLVRFDPRTRRVLSLINKQRGFYDDGGYPFAMLPSGILLQPHFAYLSFMPLTNEIYNSFAPEVQFNSVLVLNKEYRYQLNETGNTLRLGYNENFIRFEFAALVFSNANQNQYAWKLDGLDKDWLYGGNINKAVYSGLKSGTYHFRVKAANCDGVWGEEKVIKIVIRSPFYATWWFIGLCSFLVSGIIFSWNRVRVQQARKQEKLKAEFRQQISETEMKALRAQMNPHFIFNSLNSIQKYILKSEHFEASQYLTKFSRLIRLILDHSNQDFIPLASELDLLKLYVEMESLRFDNKFDYEIITNPDINTETIQLPSMLIQPYVENAIWHGLLHLPENLKGKLHIGISKDAQNSLVVTIDDNGIGREKAAELKSKQVLKKKSYGMQITEDRIAIINRVQHINAVCTVTDKHDEDGRAAGTRVVLTIPIKPIN